MEAPVVTPSQGARVCSGPSRGAVGDARAGAGVCWDRGRLQGVDLGDLRGTGVHSTGAPGCPATEAGVGEGKENEAQRGLSSCRLMWEGCDAGMDGSTVGGGHREPPPPAPGPGTPLGWLLRGTVDGCTQGDRVGSRSHPPSMPVHSPAPASPTGSPSPAAAFPLPG